VVNVVLLDQLDQPELLEYEEGMASQDPEDQLVHKEQEELRELREHEVKLEHQEKMAYQEQLEHQDLLDQQEKLEHKDHQD